MNLRFLLALIAATTLLWAAKPAPKLDLVIANARIVDGTGAPWFRGDVGVSGDTITAVGDLRVVKAVRRIDANGLILSPGFIDMLGQSELNLLIDNRAESKIRQGITTEITGEGISAAPMDATMAGEMRPLLERFRLKVDWTDFKGYWKRLEKAKPAINLASFVGAAQVRGVVLGLSDVQPTPEQLAQMEKLVERAMEDGALGLSTALIYQPGSYAKTPELIALAKAAAKHGGVYATHMRDESTKIDQALDETFQIGREAKIPIEIWHLKTAGKPVWGTMEKVLKRIERARSEGIDVAADVYPYVASANGLDANIPDWAHAGGVDAMLKRFHDPEQRKKIAGEVKETFQKTGPDGILLISSVQPPARKYAGKRLSEAAQMLGKVPEEALLDLVELDRAGITVARFSMSEDDLQAAMQRPWVSFDLDYGTAERDGPLAEDLTHPRAFGGMPRVLGRYVRELGLLRLEEAVRKMTSLPASRLRLFDRGVVRPGMAADLAVWDPDRIHDVATFEDPNRFSEGVHFVVVNGRVVLDDGKLTAERPGRVLRHKTHAH